MMQFHLYLYGPNSGPIDASFEEAAERLEAIAGVSFEPDGSFGYRSPQRGAELFGMLYDAGGKLQYVDLQGRLSPEDLQAVVQAIAGNRQSVDELCVLQLPYQTLQSFQNFLAAAPGGS